MEAISDAGGVGENAKEAREAALEENDNGQAMPDYGHTGKREVHDAPASSDGQTVQQKAMPSPTPPTKKDIGLFPDQLYAEQVLYLEPVHFLG